MIEVHKPLLPPDHIVDAVQRQLDWEGADARTAVVALQQASKVTEFSQVDALPTGTVAMDSSGELVRKCEDAT